ncbi:MAG TPA: chorismate mutase [Gaiellaceae bacterium]|nr:chorismate mutase [Gaiellaceae bacterium]
MPDETVDKLRAEIDAIDRELVALVNQRLEAVARLKRHKDERGLAFVDPHREEQLLAARLSENGGPLSEAGLRSFYAELLALTKREVA